MTGLTKDRRQSERRVKERATKDRRAREDRRAAPRASVPSEYSRELPAGPRRPAFVQTLEWIVDPKGFMTRCRRRYGDAFSVRLGPSTDVVFLSDPAAVKEVFQGPPEDMNMGDINGLFRRVLGRNSLLVLDGAEHMRQRKLLLPPFHGERIERHRAAMVKAADEDIVDMADRRAVPAPAAHAGDDPERDPPRRIRNGGRAQARRAARPARTPARAQHHDRHHPAPAAHRAGRAHARGGD